MSVYFPIWWSQLQCQAALAGRFPGWVFRLNIRRLGQAELRYDEVE